MFVCFLLWALLLVLCSVTVQLSASCYCLNKMKMKSTKMK